jgi:FLVCR family feline leukemia virus subgroup C receptor-related protein
MIIYPFVCIPEGWLVDSYSTRLGLIISSACTLAASAFKLLINKSVAWAFVGQFFAGLFQPAILNSPGKIAANWFREDVRTVITTICCLSDTIGILVGFVYHLPFLDTDKTGEDYKSDFFNYMLAEFILCAVFCLPMFFVTKNKPDIPPSPSQGNIKGAETPGLVASLKLLFGNKRFVYLLIVSFFIVGYYDVYSTIINSYFDLYGISDSKSSYIYSISCIIGMVSSIIVSYIADKTQKFKIIMVLLAITGMVFQALFTLLMHLSENNKNIHAFVTALIMYSLCNAVVVPFYTIGMNYACEITYPVGESINGGIMMSMSQVSGIAGTFLCDYLINHKEQKK